jgi:hypothetical protein
VTCRRKESTFTGELEKLGADQNKLNKINQLGPNLVLRQDLEAIFMPGFLFLRDFSLLIEK